MNFYNKEETLDLCLSAFAIQPKKCLTILWKIVNSYILD